MTDTKDRARGALLGVHAGDSLGAAVEFESPEAIRRKHPHGLREIIGGGAFDWPPGHATDDTDLTRAVVLAYLEPGDDVVDRAAQHMLAWLTGDWPGRQPGSRPVDVGGATAKGLTTYARTGDPRSSGAGEGSAGNGSLMRCIPTALATRDRDRRRRESMEISAITHDDPRCTEACAVYNEIAFTLVNGGDPREAEEAARAQSRNQAVTDALNYGRALPLAGAAATGQTFLEDAGAGFVLDSLSLAIAAVLDPRAIEDILADVVAIGRDTDTNAAIAGGLLGARDGASAIPPRWLDKLQFRTEFEQAADELNAG